jgi:hypothetical protein
MDYQRIKTQIIEEYQLRYGSGPRPFKGAERHHIIHRHEGGSNDPSNLVWLPFKAHRLIHRLDFKLDSDSLKKRHSYLMMYGYTELAKAEQVERARLKGLKAFLGSSRFKGKTQSDFQRLRCSETHKGKIVSEETRAKLSNARKGRAPWNKGLKLGEGYYKSS